ncbi:MAG: sugar phosphate isomerase/epimerase family protein [Kiritimatiellia bacterium]
MKLAFTTLGCHEWDLTEIIAKAKQHGYAGVDFRGYLSELDLWKCPEFRSGAAETRRRFEDAGLVVPCLSSSARMYAKPEDRARHLDEVAHYVEMAAALGAPYVRVFGGGLGGVGFSEALPVAGEFLVEAGRIASGAGVEVLVETHDDWVDTNWLHAALETAGFPAGVNVLWDIHHPCRHAGEDPDDTWRRIGPFVRYTHWKDSLLENPAEVAEGQAPKFQLVLPGDGDLPLMRFFDILEDSGYTGWYTLEWERKWCPELASPDVAFPRFVELMKRFARDRRHA